MTSVPRALMEVTNVDSKSTPFPMQIERVIAGNPVVQCSLLSKSPDGLAWTVVWECSQGKFYWDYDYDETILVLEGSVIIECDGSGPTRYGPGDVIFFKHGATAKWHIEDRIRKLAFCRKSQPAPLVLAFRVFSKIKRMLMPDRRRKALSLAG